MDGVNQRSGVVNQVPGAPAVALQTPQQVVQAAAARAWQAGQVGRGFAYAAMGLGGAMEVTGIVLLSAYTDCTTGAFKAGQALVVLGVTALVGGLCSVNAAKGEHKRVLEEANNA